MEHRTTAQLEAALAEISQAPKDTGRLELMVIRPAENERQVLEQGALEFFTGLSGDTWRKRTKSLSPNPDSQVTLINARVIAAIAQTKERWPLAGDQLYVDLDLSVANLPVGTQLKIGSAVIEITALPHTGCEKFGQRYGLDALAFVNSREHKGLRLRGVKTRVVQAGLIQTGDAIEKL